MPKYLLLILSLTVIILTAYLTLLINSNSPKVLSKSEIDTAINQARHFYRQEKERGKDFSSGPCLSNAIMPNWVLDIAHNPRESMDDLAQNQCPAYLEGRAEHIVELDPDGNLIRVK